MDNLPSEILCMIFRFLPRVTPRLCDKKLVRDVMRGEIDTNIEVRPTSNWMSVMLTCRRFYELGSIVYLFFRPFSGWLSLYRLTPIPGYDIILPISRREVFGMFPNGTLLRTRLRLIDVILKFCDKHHYCKSYILIFPFHRMRMNSGMARSRWVDYENDVEGWANLTNPPRQCKHWDLQPLPSPPKLVHNKRPAKYGMKMWNR